MAEFQEVMKQRKRMCEHFSSDNCKKCKIFQRNMEDEEFCYCHQDYEDEEHDCLDYMECEECPYYYADED